ncbi:MAG: nuclear transport factor 2 family protein [Fimbriimonadaceae bacterium]
MIGQLMRTYVDFFNAADEDGLLGTLHPEVVHEINEGGQEIGLEAFRKFREHMNSCYKEQLKGVVYFENGDRGAIEFICEGEYISTDGNLPVANGQKYAIRAAAFFEMKEEKLSRVTSFYNLREWIAAVSQ